MASSSSPRVVISILNWNGAAKTLACLQSLKAQSYTNTTIRVVDNGSTDDSCAMIASAFPEVDLRGNSTNLGFAAGHNQVLREALGEGADYAWILNNDVEVQENALDALVELAESDPAIGLVSPVLYDRDDPSWVQFCGSWIDWAACEIRYSSDPQEIAAQEAARPADMVLWGTALLIKRTVLERVGLLDEALFAYYEDSDLCVRAARSGFLSRVAFSSSVLHEFHRSTRTRPPYFFYLMARNAYFFWIKHLPEREKRRYRQKHFARTIGEAASNRDHGNLEQQHACLAGLVDAWRGLGGPPRPDQELPFWLRRVAMWHPYLTAALIEGDMHRALGIVRDKLTRVA